jgi:hypothetical protein
MTSKSHREDALVVLCFGLGDCLSRFIWFVRRGMYVCMVGMVCMYVCVRCDDDAVRLLWGPAVLLVDQAVESVLEVVRFKSRIGWQSSVGP